MSPRSIKLDEVKVVRRERTLSAWLFCNLSQHTIHIYISPAAVHSSHKPKNTQKILSVGGGENQTDLSVTKMCYVELFLVTVAILHLPHWISHWLSYCPHTRVRESSRSTLCSTVSLLRACQGPLLHAEWNLRSPYMTMQSALVLLRSLQFLCCSSEQIKPVMLLQ